MDDDDDDLSADDLLALLRGTNGGSFITLEGGSLRFKVTEASIRPDHDPAAIPLPAAGWMLIAGLGGLVALRRVKT